MKKSRFYHGVPWTPGCGGGEGQSRGADGAGRPGCGIRRAAPSRREDRNENECA
jgi:hypothetical protein